MNREKKLRQLKTLKLMHYEWIAIGIGGEVRAYKKKPKREGGRWISAETDVMKDDWLIIGNEEQEWGELIPDISEAIKVDDLETKLEFEKEHEERHPESKYEQFTNGLGHVSRDDQSIKPEARPTTDWYEKELYELRSKVHNLEYEKELLLIQLIKLTSNDPSKCY